jgi:hypothetical protein
MDRGPARYHRPGIPRPDRYTDHLLDRVVADLLTPEDPGVVALLAALHGPPSPAELERRSVVVPYLAAVVRASARPPEPDAPTTA